MTSQPSRDDLEEFLAGRGMPSGEIFKFMKIVDLYAVSVARGTLGRRIPEPPVARGRKYKCRTCGLSKPLGDFPETKRDNPRMAVPCTYCATRAS